ncbi:BTAD domain-containing putative transcriptional regulator [Catenuloplanes japonicus]|uniref:BTAD domain-containing putative transcriptional regulator n=1 Tax=Catenuloplanes japonicus TaxID=33876 RepID=UPI0007C43EE9|nr:BTAD domain-containing putative transcriptional regulator [Catenuloplanes japonicus]
MTGLRVAVLGPVRAWDGEREITLGAARPTALFAVLAAHANRPVSRAELVDALWDGSPPATASGVVYTYLSGLRRAGAGAHLDSGPAGYTLRVPPGGLDTDRFTDLCARAAARHADGDLPGAAARYGEALALWQGDAFAGLPGGRLAYARVRLAEQRRAAAEQHARILLDLGDERAVAELAVLVREHPLHEPLYGLLMRALGRAGRHAEALNVFQDARRVLDAELGAAPGAELTALHDRALARSSPPPGVLTAAPLPPLVGRAAELTRIRELVEAVAAGHGGALWLEGPPGIGKTALLDVSLGSGVRLARARADERDSGAALGVVRRALALDGDEDPMARIRELCAAGPLILAVEDLQWADPAMPSFVARLLAAARRLPLLFIGTARPDPGDARVTGMRHEILARHGQVLTLRELTGPDLRDLIALAAGAPLGPGIQSRLPWVVGNPLMVRQSIDLMRRRGELRISGGVADLVAAGSCTETLDEVILAGVDVLGGHMRDVLTAAALLASPFPVADVIALLDRPAFDVALDLEVALTAGVLAEEGPDLVFQHPYVRQVLREQAPPAVRTARHRRAAEMLAARDDVPAGRVAAHLAAGGLPADGRWAVAWLAGRRDDLAAESPGPARDLFRQALRSGLPTPRERGRLLVALARLDLRHEGMPESEAVEALSLTGDPADRAELRQILASVRIRQGDPDGATALLDVAAADPETPADWRVRHRRLLVTLRRTALRTAHDLDLAERRARQPGDAPGVSLQTRWMVASIRHADRRALTLADEALALPGLPPDLHVTLLDNRSATLQWLDRLDDAGRDVRDAGLLAVRHGLPGAPHASAATLAYRAGRWDHAFAEVEAEVGALPGEYPVAWQSSTLATLFGVASLIATRRNDPVLAAAYLEWTQRLAPPTTEQTGFLAVARSWAAEVREGPAAALVCLEPLLTADPALAGRRGEWLPRAVRLALGSGQSDVAHDLAGLPSTEIAASYCRALVGADPGGVLEAAGALGKRGRPVEEAGALEEAAVLLAAARQPHDAARYGGEALARYARVTAATDVRRLTDRLAAYGVTPF